MAPWKYNMCVTTHKAINIWHRSSGKISFLKTTQVFPGRRGIPINVSMFSKGIPSSFCDVIDSSLALVNSPRHGHNPYKLLERQYDSIQTWLLHDFSQ